MNNTELLKGPYSLFPNTFRFVHLGKHTDFGDEWYDLPCADSYWNTIKPIFAKLQTLKEKNVAWNDMSDKEDNERKEIT